MSKINEALSKLDPANPDDWTSDGAPRLDVLERLLGEKVTRKQLTDAAPNFNRDTALSMAADAKAKSDAPPPPPAEEKPFVPAPVKGEPDEPPVFEEHQQAPRDPELDELEAAKGKLAAEQKALGEHIKGLQAQFHELTKEIDKVQIAINDRIPSGSNQGAIRAYIDQQNAQRLARHNARTAVLRSLDPRLLNPKSQLDQAMARDTRRGLRRPTRQGA